MALTFTPCGVETLAILNASGSDVFWTLPALIASTDSSVSLSVHCSPSSVAGTPISFFLYSSDASLTKVDENSVFLREV